MGAASTPGEPTSHTEVHSLERRIAWNPQVPLETARTLRLSLPPSLTGKARLVCGCPPRCSWPQHPPALRGPDGERVSRSLCLDLEYNTTQRRPSHLSCSSGPQNDAPWRSHKRLAEARKQRSQLRSSLTWLSAKRQRTRRGLVRLFARRLVPRQAAHRIAVAAAAHTRLGSTHERALRAGAFAIARRSVLTKRGPAWRTGGGTRTLVEGALLSR